MSISRRKFLIANGAVMVLPILPSLMFGIGLLMFEHQMLRREFAYLRSQLATPRSESDVDA